MEEKCEDIKHYHEPEFDPRTFLNHYFSADSDKSIQETTLFFPMKQMYKALLTGHITGDTLIDIALGPILHHIIPSCKFFKEITILEFNDMCIKEMEKWLNNETEAFDWSHANKFLMELGWNSIHWQEQEKMLKAKIKRILKCDLTKENITDPVILPKADCLMCMGALDAMSKDHEGYCQNLKKFSTLLKPGGILILLGAFNATFYLVGDHRFHILNYNEPFLRQTLCDEDYTIDCFERRGVIHSLVGEEHSYRGIYFKKRALHSVPHAVSPGQRI